MFAYGVDTDWSRRIPCIFFKTLMQLYLLRSFLYSLTYCIKEVIKGKIFWRLNKKKCRPIRQLRPKTGQSLVLVKNNDLIVFVLFNFYFWLTVSKRVSKAIFLHIKFKSVGLWGSYGLKQGNPWKSLEVLIKLYLFCLLIYCST